MSPKLSQLIDVHCLAIDACERTDVSTRPNDVGHCRPDLYRLADLSQFRSERNVGQLLRPAVILDTFDLTRQLYLAVISQIRANVRFLRLLR